jgi:hypothetical protein
LLFDEERIRQKNTQIIINQLLRRQRGIPGIFPCAEAAAGLLMMMMMMSYVVHLKAAYY